MFLVIVMLFSTSSVSFASEISVTEATNTTEDYTDYLENRINDTETNIFVKILVKIVLIFIRIGFIDAEDFLNWFEKTYSENNSEAETTTKEEEHIHNFTVKEITFEPTCLNNGTQKLICICGEEIAESIDALGHDYLLTTEEAPTCKRQGKYVFTCSRCLYTKTEYIDRIDHDYQITEEKPAGCETLGHIRYQCANCTSVKAEQLPATGHNYNKDTGLCENCGMSDPTHYDKIPLGGTWTVEDNWEISIESVVNHPLHSTSINESQGYTDQPCVLITYKVKNIGYKPHLENATGLIITPLDFKVYDETGLMASNYVCSHTKYAQVSIDGLSDIGITPVVLLNDSEAITFVISEYDSNGITRKAIFTANVTD